MIEEENNRHCAGCGAGIRAILEDIDKSEKEAHELSEKDKIPVAIYKDEQGYHVCNAFDAYRNNYNVIKVVSRYNTPAAVKIH
jgi:hypothetical protein